MPESVCCVEEVGEANEACSSLVEMQKEVDRLRSVLSEVVNIFLARPDIVARVRPLMGWAEWGAIEKAKAELSAVK